MIIASCMTSGGSASISDSYTLRSLCSSRGGKFILPNGDDANARQAGREGIWSRPCNNDAKNIFVSMSIFCNQIKPCCRSGKTSVGLERVRTRTRRLEDSERILETRLGSASKAKTRQTRESSLARGSSRGRGYQKLENQKTTKKMRKQGCQFGC